MKTAKMICECECAVQEDKARDTATRLFAKDATLWSENAETQAKILNRLGWLDAPEAMLSLAPQVIEVVDRVRAAGFTTAVLLGMGGSSLCPEVMSKVFGTAKDYLKLMVLDSTAPESVAAIDNAVELEKTLFIPASKSGSTIETNVMYAYYYDRLLKAGVENPGRHFVAITDPGSSMEKLAAEKSFLHCFLNPPQIGGRFSALSLFGLFPMALLGINIEEMLMRVNEVSSQSSEFVRNAMSLGLRLGTAAQKGRNKLTFQMSPKLKPLGDWIEQLVAESTGKNGKGILPVVGEKNGAQSDDRIYVQMSVGTEATPECCGCTKSPRIEIKLDDLLDIGCEFYRWELMTAAMGVALEENPFDEPNVTESKQNTMALLNSYSEKGELPLPEFCGKFGELIRVSPTAALHDAVAAKEGVAPACPLGLAEALRMLTSTVNTGDYVTLSAFVAPTAERLVALQSIRGALGVKTGCPTTLGIGPRFLHSTGQLHKGGPNQGVYLVIATVANAATDLTIPGYPYSFGTLCLAQGLGDFSSLDRHGRRAMLLLVDDVDKALAYIADSLK
ncbi:hypothetical protein GX645_05420 [Candidatus Sumerlaeota bacterium]|nr:hypothetical protein [Candidatus Sumerlaeota bacterium]